VTGTAVEQLRAVLADQYTLERELGRGGMATVYLAQDLKHSRPVALKVLRPDVTEALGSTEFLRESRIAARLAHPNILSVHDSGEAAGLQLCDAVRHRRHPPRQDGTSPGLIAM
jgi:serine/threonine protein kinase